MCNGLKTLTLSILVAVLLGCSPAHRTAQRLLFVVPEELPDGTSSAAQQAALEEWMASRAGGFTRLDGAHGGWMGPDGEVVREDNVLYLLTFPEGDRADGALEVEQRILRDFQQQEAWIQKW
jgi:hypothetical protein